MKSVAILRIFKNENFLGVKQFDSSQILFGSEGDVQVELQDDSISPLHFLIELRDSGYYISDLGSSTGTKKNGNPVLDGPLSSGDSIEAGPFKVQFLIQTKKVKTETSPKIEPAIEPKIEPEAAPVIVVSVPAAPVIKIEPLNTEPPTRSALPPARPPILPDKSAMSSGDSKVSLRRKKKGRKTFAPPSEIRDLRSYIRPTKGTTVEVIVAWQERILSTKHFSAEGTFTIGPASDANISIPSSFLRSTLPFVEIKGGCRILAGPEMTAEIYTTGSAVIGIAELARMGRALKLNSGGFAIKVESGEVLCLSLSGTVHIYVRFVQAVRPPFFVSPFDFSASEITALVISLVLVGLLGLFMSTYAPDEQAEKPPDEKLRMATFIYKKPPPTLPPLVDTPVTIPPLPVPVAATTPKPKKIVVADMTKQGAKQKGGAKSAEIKPKEKINRPVKFTSTKEGGAVKIGKVEGGAAKAKDVSKVGLLGTFGGGGIREQIDKTASGADALLGMAEKATGKSGQNEDRSGKDIGSKFKDTGAGGKGTATQGISGIGLKGRSSGNQAYGASSGLGGKGNVSIDVAGEDANWEGSIDREAVRRVIRSILNQIKSCYERQLRTDSSLEGKVVIEFQIVDQGRVQSAKTSTTTLKNAAVEQCVAARIREARFPEPPTGTVAVVYYPFVFGAQK